jgi:two-component system phosphate regulon sensor histidine kinase PhoR
MKRKRLLWQLFLPYVAITLLSLLAVGWYASKSIEQFYLDRVATDLESRARILEPSVRDKIHPPLSTHLDRHCKQIGNSTSTRITVILPSGTVIADSEKDPKTMDNHADRPEIIDALSTGKGVAIRYSNTLRANMIYMAILLEEGKDTHAILRLSVPLTSITRALRTVRLEIAAGGFIIAFLATLVSLFIARRIIQPIEEITRGAEQFSRGELKHRVPFLQTSTEIGALADAMNTMASQLEERINTITHQRNEREAVLSSMVEGVLALDMDMRIISINDAALAMLDISGENVTGRGIQEVVRHTKMQHFIDGTLNNPGRLEEELVFRGETVRYIHANGTRLRDGKGHRIGAVIVLNDISRLHRLENVRKDFVANVSHELRTPITKIRGFAETLLDGAMNNVDDAKRFLRIIAEQTGRLNSMIEDLLSLSRIEKESDRGEIEFTAESIEQVLRNSVADCEQKAAAKGISFTVQCPHDLQCRINRSLIERAVTNLLDNAINYSDTGKPVLLRAMRADGEVVIHVQDQGCGIEKDHLARIFERFYRINKAKSKKLGGTGLGLAIVKHIVHAHSGWITVDSTPGQGSTFTIHLPTS